MHGATIIKKRINNFERQSRVWLSSSVAWPSIIPPSQKKKTKSRRSRSKTCNSLPNTFLCYDISLSNNIQKAIRFQLLTDPRFRGDMWLITTLLPPTWHCLRLTGRPLLSVIGCAHLFNWLSIQSMLFIAHSSYCDQNSSSISWRIYKKVIEILHWLILRSPLLPTDQSSPKFLSFYKISSKPKCNNNYEWTWIYSILPTPINP